MATQLLALGTTAASSASFTLASGESATIAMKGAERQTGLIVEMQDDASGWNAVGVVTGAEGKVVSGPGIFRVTRLAGSGNVGAFRG